MKYNVELVKQEKTRIISLVNDFKENFIVEIEHAIIDYNSELTLNRKNPPNSNESEIYEGMKKKIKQASIDLMDEVNSAYLAFHHASDAGDLKQNSSEKADIGKASPDSEVRHVKQGPSETVASINKMNNVSIASLTKFTKECNSIIKDAFRENNSLKVNTIGDKIYNIGKFILDGIKNLSRKLGFTKKQSNKLDKAIETFEELLSATQNRIQTSSEVYKQKINQGKGKSFTGEDKSIVKLPPSSKLNP